MNRHFVTGNFKSHAKFVPDETYGQILDNVVITCVDIVCTYEGKMLIGKRVIEPQPDWWIIGGRMYPGESFESTAIRNLTREIGLEVTFPQRFNMLNSYSLVWATRAQEPVSNGCHTTSITLVLELGEDEVDMIKANEEYEELRWISPQDIISGDFHPCLIKMASDLIE